MKHSPRTLWRILLCLALVLLMLPYQAFAMAVLEKDAVVYHNLTVDPNGGAFSDHTTAPKTFKLRSTGYLTADDLSTATDLSRDGYLPLGYGTSPSGPVTVRLAKLGNTRFTEDTTLYVIWGKAIQMTIHANGGFLFAHTSSGYELLPDPYVTTVAAGDQMLVSVLKQLAVRDNYEFGGLSTDVEGNEPVSTQVIDGEECFTFPEHDVDYYIQWNGPYMLAITQQPEDVTAAVGETAQFTVAATGVYVKYQWQYKSGGKWVDSKMTGYDTPTLSVPVTGARNGRVYRCHVLDKSGDSVDSASAKLTVTTTVTAQPRDVTAPVNDTATFTVSATGAKLKYSWQYNKGNGWANSGMDGYNTATLSVPVTAARNGYQYRCVITNANGTKTTTQAATLLVKTVITVQPKIMLGPIGNTVKFTVKATGAGLTYQWQYYTGKTWLNSGMNGSQTRILEVPVTAARNGQLYRCVITDANGVKTISDSGKLKVKTVIISQPKDVTVSKGDTAAFTVKATGAGLTYRWQYNKGNGWANSTMDGAQTATLTVTATAGRNGQQYRCVITDANGKKTYSDVATMIVG
ncbi:MAG: immunoglobulin domain-containing protein [Oscillospiraceae bacterium]|nr:immunoglobulin domain-containing protein [Oscillospiraceae bacterium]